MEKTRHPAKVIGYIRVSTREQNTEINEAAILKYANDNDFGKVRFVIDKVSGTRSWKKRKMNEVVQSLNPEDILIVSELSRLGRSIRDILDLLNTLSEKQVKVYSVKENFQLNGEDIQSKVMRTMFSLFAEIERDLIRERTIEGLEAAALKGNFPGRPKGPGKSRLDPHREDIINLLKNGSTKVFVAS